jgi:hypothetical protein
MTTFRNLTTSLLTPEQVEAFLDECFSTDPDLKDNFTPGQFRDVLHDTGGQGLCWDVSIELVKFMQRNVGSGCTSLRELAFPNDIYPNVDPSEEPPNFTHYVVLINGIVHDFTATQFGDYPVPYVWDWEVYRDRLA